VCGVAARATFSSSLPLSACIQKSYLLLSETLRLLNALVVIIFSSGCWRMPQAEAAGALRRDRSQLRRCQQIVTSGSTMDRRGRIVDSSPLSIQCGSCGLAEVDDYEVLEANSIHSMRCAGCGAVIRFALIECLACGEETLFPLASEPAPEELRILMCAACEQPYGDEAVNTLRIS
jgi:hypothetical protein